MKTKAMVLEQFNQPLVLREFELPALQPGEVLIRMEAAGVCGSDVHMLRGKIPGRRCRLFWVMKGSAGYWKSTAKKGPLTAIC